MEHYSRDRVFLRILNTISFILLFAVVIKFYFFNGDMSFFKSYDKNFYLAPYKIIYILDFITFLFLTIFIMVQVDSSSYGIKKQAIENYGILVFLTFLFMSLSIYFKLKNENISLIFRILSIFTSIIIYLKSQKLRIYMYKDELKVFYNPFSMLLVYNIMQTIISINLILTNILDINSKYFYIIAFLEIFLILIITILTLVFFNDKIISFFFIIFLFSTAINTKLNGYFMPIGYIYFLSIILILVVLFKILRKK